MVATAASTDARLVTSHCSGADRQALRGKRGHFTRLGVVVQVHGHHMRALARQAFDDGQADAARGAGDEGDFLLGKGTMNLL